MKYFEILFRFFFFVLLSTGVTFGITIPLPFGTSGQTTYNSTVRPFKVRNPASTQNIAGNYAIIGNSNQCSVDGHAAPPWTGKCIKSSDSRSYSNSYPSRYIDIDGNATTKNSTSSTLKIPPGSKVVWAGLYWQGVVHNSLQNGNYKHITGKRDADFMGTPGKADGIIIKDEPTFYDPYKSPNQINFGKAKGGTYGADKVLLKLPGGNYQEITADVLDYQKLGYAGFKDITSLINKKRPNGRYMVADIKSNQGLETNHGNYAAWAIVVIYENPNESLKNISLFDGYTTVDNHFNQNLVMSGFYTSKKLPVKSKIAMFVMDGDNGSNALTVISEKGKKTKIKNADYKQHSLFDATISKSIIRKPNTSSLRTDLKVIDLQDVLGPGERKATLEPRTRGDRYTPSFFIMSAELYTPEVCYDYTVDLGTGRYLTDDSHDINSPISRDKNMTTKVFVKVTEGDFDLLNNTLYLSGLKRKKWHFHSGESSPSNTAAYYPAIVVDPSASHSGIAIGDDDGNMTNGGLFKEKTNYYAKFHHQYTYNSLLVNEHINIELHSHIDFGYGEIPLTFMTDNGSLARCKRNLVYNPVHGRFNIERPNNTQEPDATKYTLYTQVSNRDFDIDVVSYDANSLSTPLAIQDVGVELELFDAGTFDNNASTGYDTVCHDPDKSRIFARQFVTFPKNTPKDRISLTGQNDFAVPVALRSAAFRIWYITDANNTLVFGNDCYAPTMSDRDGCFAKAYANVSQQLDPTGYCTKECSKNSSTGCYECLKRNFAQPVCSRDNFAIRPESYRIVISDDREGTAGSTVEIARNDNSAATSYAAGYSYRIDANATQWRNDQVAQRYYANFTGTNAAKLAFADSSSCADRNDTILPAYNFDGGRLTTNTIANDNVGQYTFELIDKEWTAVDQAGNPLKPYPNVGDCIGSDKSVGATKYQQSGCWFSSKYDPAHTEMTLDFNPYSFDLSGLKLDTGVSSSTEWLYMDDLTKDQTMGFKFEGNITAINKKGAVTTNFTDTCAAKPVEIWMARTMSPDEANVTDSNGTFVPFQQALNTVVTETNLVSQDINSTLAGSAFSDADQGVATAELIYNFKKGYTSPVSPVDVNFSTLYAASSAARSHAEMRSNYTPEGNMTIDENRTFYYARVSPTPGIDGTEVYELSINTNFRVLSYCDTAVTTDCNLSGMDIGTSEEKSGTAGWYLMQGHQSASGDGEIKDFKVESTDPAGHKGDVNITNTGTLPLQFVNGIYSKSTLSVPFNKRTVKATFVITPDEWLKHNPGNTDGLPRFDIIFIKSGLQWKGMGETGHVIGTEPTHNNKGRLGW